MSPMVVVAFLITVLGLGVAWSTALKPTETGDTAEDYLISLDRPDVSDDLDEYSAKLQEPVLTRLIRPLTNSAGQGIVSITPRAQLDRIHAQLLQAGLSATIRAEELAVLQILSTLGAGVLGILLTLAVRPSLPLATLLVIGMPVAGLFLPQAWLNRKVEERKDAIRGDLPDVLDLMAISVEAGTGFEGALAVVTENFTSPLSEELSRTLKEMELGLSRREALQNLKRRTEVPELSNFVLAIVQADALGMPIGRVLKTQAVEMRNKRRAWAREKAAKLPVKIMLPLVLFIFPSILVVTMGPAVSSLVGNLGS